MNANEFIISGISIRETQVRRWLKSQNFKGEYLLVSTKQESVYFKKLVSLPAATKLIVDLYTPILLEKELTLSKWKPQDWLIRLRNKQMVKQFLKRGNHFLVANHRQREYWIKGSRNLGVSLRKEDISVLPTGGGNGTKNKKQKTKNERRKVILWFGGIYPWMNPLPLVEAFSRICREYPKWKLRFLGGFHPDTGYKDLYQKVESMAKSKIPSDQLEFIPWQSEQNLTKFFLDAAVAIHLTKSSLEDYYAHRVRLLTLLEAGIPIITGGKDIVSDLITAHQAGIRARSQEELATILSRIMANPKILDKWKLSTKKIQNIFLRKEHDLVEWQNI